MVTIREVARESGVSAATVSHVLNGTRRVEPETAARVRAAIEKLGYRPLREYDRYGLRGIRLAGFFAHGTGMCACADFFGLLEQRLAEHKIQLVLIAAPETIPDGELRALQRFHRLSFCVVHTSVRVPPARREAPPYEVPTVFLSSTPPPAGNSCAVSFDYRQAVRMALSHLISRGHREITILTSIHNIDVTEEIRAGPLCRPGAGVLALPIFKHRAGRGGGERGRPGGGGRAFRAPSGPDGGGRRRDVGDGARRREPAQARAGLPERRLARGDGRALRDGGEPSRPDAGGSRRAPAGRRGRPGADQ